MRRLALLAVFLLALLDGCTCRKKTDEEVLKQTIDASPVHLWLAAKIAMHPDEGGDDVKTARKHLKLLFEAAEAKDPSKVDIPPKEAAAIVLALWELRGLGKAALAKNDPAVPKPILAAVLKESLTKKGELAEVLDANLEHAIFLVGLIAAKIHPKLAVPVPPEILLYEAWSTHASELPLESLKPLVRSVKAYVYGTSELCDLAAKEADAIGDDPFDAKTIAADAKVFTGEAPQLPPKSSKELGAAVSVLANGATALCYMQRKEADKAVPHVRKTLVAAEALGVATPETDFLRGWVECADGDPEEGKKRLAKILADPDTPARRKDAAALIEANCGKGKGVVAKLVDRAVLASVIGLLALEHLERAGVGDAVADTTVARFVAGLARGFGGAVDQAKSSIPSYDGAKKGIQGLFSK